MKMIYNGVPVQSMKVNHYEMNTNDCTMVASDLQAGITAVARGQKITGTGKSFEFAWYGAFETNDFIPVPDNINVIGISSITNPVQLLIELSNMKNVDFSIIQTVGNVVINNVSHPITVQVENNMLSIGCSASVRLQIFYGKDNYI